MSEPAALATAGLRLEIGGAVIVDDVSMTVPPGEMLGIIGPNGAGKTTLFNLISGLTRPSAGRISFDDRDITDAAAHQRARAGLGRTFQTSSVFAALPTVENARLAARTRRDAHGRLSLLSGPRRLDDATRTARQALAEVGLSRRADTPAGALSHGDKRKLELAMLLATDPRLIMLDEPMAGVGMGDVDGLTELIGKVHTERGCTVVMIEHHIDVLLGLVDRVAVMHHGQLLTVDTPQAVMADPAVQRVYLGGAP